MNGHPLAANSVASILSKLSAQATIARAPVTIPLLFSRYDGIKILARWSCDINSPCADIEHLSAGITCVSPEHLALIKDVKEAGLRMLISTFRAAMLCDVFPIPVGSWTALNGMIYCWNRINFEVVVLMNLVGPAAHVLTMRC